MEELVEGQVGAVRDVILDVVAEELQVKKVGAVDVVFEDYVADAVLHLYETGKPQNMLHRPVQFALFNQSDLFYHFVYVLSLLIALKHHDKHLLPLITLEAS